MIAEEIETDETMKWEEEEVKSENNEYEEHTSPPEG